MLQQLYGLETPQQIVRDAEQQRVCLNVSTNILSKSEVLVAVRTAVLMHVSDVYNGVTGGGAPGDTFQGVTP